MTTQVLFLLVCLDEAQTSRDKVQCAQGGVLVVRGSTLPAIFNKATPLQAALLSKHNPTRRLLVSACHCTGYRIQCGTNAI